MPRQQTRNYISDTAKKNIVQNTYLHSNRFNFYQVANTYNTINLNGKDTWYDLKKVKKKLEARKIALEAEEKEFYRAFGLNEERGNIEFSQKYLLMDKRKKISNEDIGSNKILKEDWYNFIKILDEKKGYYSNLLAGGFKLEYYRNSKSGKEITRIFSEIGSDAIIDAILEALKKGSLTSQQRKKAGISNGFITPGVLTKFIEQNSTKKIKVKINKNGELNSAGIGALNDILKNMRDVQRENLNILRTSLIKDFNDALKENNRDTGVVSNTTIRLALDDFITIIKDVTTKEIEKVEQGKNKGTWTISGASTKISSNATKGLGDLAEIQIGLLATKYWGEILKETKTKMTGATNTTRDFVITKQSKKDSKRFNQVEKKTGESPTDMEFTAGGRTYRFQIKNSLVELGWTSIKINNDVKMDTTIDTMIHNGLINDLNAKEIYYLFANLFFFQNTNKNENKLKVRDAQLSGIDVYTRVNLIMKTLIEYFLELEFSKELNKESNKVVKNMGNTFFIYKNKYLIPISWYYTTVIEEINEFFEITNKETNKNGRLVTIRNLSQYSPSNSSNIYPNPKTFWQGKLEILRTIKQDKADKESKQLNYPSNLLNYGSVAGNTAIHQLKFNKVLLTTNINKLETYFMNKI